MCKECGEDASQAHIDKDHLQCMACNATIKIKEGKKCQHEKEKTEKTSKPIEKA